ncbi:phytoene desaturase family protein [Aquabacter spiritensis]|uniref:Phytoene dehydrogenase-like protein n=1 Tax=Aquabacter spiritensis TaxID=933073 RepID=A0A4R3LM49_9HYPH|nr:NAD(P)/FAD-dependent oxidoreductase [Aquabacter spiritensis]TCT00599.1 phytoene dehydrogenase-like protein [Aquabacter spiritensis]
MTSYDGVIIGAGHNSLVMAAYLTRAGLKIAVLERNDRVGGGCTTEEPALPGYRFNIHSNFYMGFRHAPFMRDLELYRYGFSFVEPLVQQGTTFSDGTCIVLHQDLEASCAAIARFSKRDADTFRELSLRYDQEMRPLLTSLRYNAPLPPDVLRDRLSGPQGKEFLSHGRFDLFGVIRHYFEHERVRTMFAALMHVGTIENAPGAGALFPGSMAAVRAYTLPVGGSASFTRALERVLEAGGSRVICNADVREIVVENGRATGVRLDTGETVRATRFVASGIDAPTTMRISGEEHYSQSVRDKLKNWYWGNHSSVTLHLALKRPPTYRSAAYDPEIGKAFNIFFGMDSLDDIEASFHDCETGRFPSILMGNGACNSAVDPLYAPAEGHVAFWWPFAPYSVDGSPSNWDDRAEDYAARLLEHWRAHSDNLDGDNIRASHLATPLDYERLNVNMVQGAARMGAWVPSQLGYNRPHPELSGTRTPIEGLYLCGSSTTGAGGGLNGAPGYIAANAVSDDLGLVRTWTPVPAPEWTH